MKHVAKCVLQHTQAMRTSYTRRVCC